MIERRRPANELDSCMWFCESCGNMLHKATFHLDDIVSQLPGLMTAYYDNLDLRTCKKCGTVMEVPVLENSK